MKQDLFEERAEDKNQRRSDWPKLILAIAAVIGISFVLKAIGVGEYLKQALDWVDGLGHWGPIAFVFLYIVITVALIPGSILTVGSGAVFGVFWGTVWVSLGSVIGASIAFLIGRHAARHWVEEKIKDNPKFVAVDQAIGEKSWKIVFLVRLSPLFPFNFLNYALGLSKIGFWPHLTASWPGMLPGTLMYVYFGSLTAAGVRAEGGRSPLEWSLLAAGLLATIAVSLYIATIAKQAIEENLSQIGESEKSNGVEGSTS